MFFDPHSLGSERERSVQREVSLQAPDICWDVTNQAGVHLWYPNVFRLEVEPLMSSADGVGTWPETATAVGVRLLGDDSIEVVAPCGLEDLFGLICQRNPRRVSVEHYRSRLKSKQIATRWPESKDPRRLLEHGDLRADGRPRCPCRRDRDRPIAEIGPQDFHNGSVVSTSPGLRPANMCRRGKTSG